MHQTQISPRRRAEWSKRIDRAGELAERNPWAAEVLRFYQRVLEFQRSIYESIATQASPAQHSLSLREALDFCRAAENFSALLSVLCEHGPKLMAESAAELRSLSASEVEQLLRRCAADEATSETEHLLGLALLQPYAERSALRSNCENQDSGRGFCPACDGRPLVGLLRPEGDGGKRSLVCSFCLSEWDFRRILCPYCGEQDNSKLPTYSAAEGSAISVCACLTCRRYLKQVDMTVDGNAVPIVDEVASATLDVWAAQQGFHKLQPGLLGF